MTAGLLLVTVACESTRTTPVYDRKTGALVRIESDYNGDGKSDVTTYMENGRAVRLEGDTDGDGRIDRWEYYTADGQLERIGGSRARDGREDSWAYPSANGVRVDLSTRRDGSVDRREFHRGKTLVSAELDTNGDGRMDTWEHYENGRVAVWLVDERMTLGRPTRRVTYVKGSSPRIETDADGDGVFTPEAHDAAR